MYQQNNQQTRGPQQQKAPQQQRQPDKQLMTVVPGSNPLGLPSEAEWMQIKEICGAAVRSGMLPNAIKTPEAAAIIALKSRELGIPLMVGFAHIHVINGKPSMSAELIQAQARKNLPGLVFNILETNNNLCVVQGCRPEKGSTPIKLSFTYEDARKANLLIKDVWKQYPAAMLRSRAITACLRILCPDALMGVSYTPEELGSDSTDDAIETTARPVSAEESAANPAPESPQNEKPIEESPEDLALKQKRKQVWNLWKSGQGTEDGFKRFVDMRFGKKPGQPLSIDQLGEIEHYISTQINERPPQPLDPVEPSDSQEPSEPAPVAEKADWEKEADNSDFGRK